MCQEHLNFVLKSTMKYSAYATQNAHKIKWENIVNCLVTKKSVSLFSILIHIANLFL